MKKILIFSTIIIVALCMYLYVNRNFVRKDKTNPGMQSMVYMPLIYENF